MAMRIRVRIEGLNLEKLLRAAAEEDIVLYGVRRLHPRGITAEVSLLRLKALTALCERYGWQAEECGASRLVRILRTMKRHGALVAGMLLCIALVKVSSQMVLRVEIENAREHEAVVRTELRAAGAGVGRLKRSLSLDALRGRLQTALPGLSFAGARFAGSTLIVSCWPSVEGEDLSVWGSSLHIVAAEDGVIKRIWASSGTPQVAPGQVVRKGQVLIRGEERTEKGQLRAVQAQGQAIARVWKRGDAKVALYEREALPTGRTRRRVTLQTPWYERVVTDAQPFETQEVDVQLQPIAGLYLPLRRKIERYEEVQIRKRRRKETDCRSMAQGAAEEIAKNNCPPDVQILDKSVHYSMIDDEFVYASVVLEYERDIASREDAL